MAIEKTDAGTMITGADIQTYQLLANWTRGTLEVSSQTGGKVNPQVFRWMAARCESPKRTHAGILTDYTIWLAGYGIEPKAIDRLRTALNTTGRRTLEIGLRRARKLAAERKAASG